MALEETQKEADRLATTKQGTVSSGQLTQSALNDLLSLGVGDLVSSNSDQPSFSGSWNNMGMADPWGVPQSSAAALGHTSDGFLTSSNNDPWATSTAPQPAASNSDPFATCETPATSAPAATLISSNSFDLLGGDLLSPTDSMTGSTTNSTNGTRKTPENFLGENKNLVNLDITLFVLELEFPNGNSLKMNISENTNSKTLVSDISTLFKLNDSQCDKLEIFINTQKQNRLICLSTRPIQLIEMKCW